MVFKVYQKKKGDFFSPSLNYFLFLLPLLCAFLYVIISSFLLLTCIYFLASHIYHKASKVETTKESTHTHMKRKCWNTLRCSKNLTS